MSGSDTDTKLAELGKIRDPDEFLEGLKCFLEDVSARYEPADLAGSLKFLSGTMKILREDHERSFSGFTGAARRVVESTREYGRPNEAAVKEMQFWFRTSVRAFVSEIEGTTFAMRQVVVWASRRGEIELSNAEEAQLKEVALHPKPPLDDILGDGSGPGRRPTLVSCPQRADAINTALVGEKT